MDASEEVCLLGLSKSSRRLQRKHYAKLLLTNLGKVLCTQQTHSLQHRWSKARATLLELMEQLPRQVIKRAASGLNGTVEYHAGIIISCGEGGQ